MTTENSNDNGNVIEKVFKEGVLMQIRCGCWTAQSNKIRDGEVDTNTEVIKSKKMLLDWDCVQQGVRRSESRCRSAIRKYGFAFLNMDSVYFVPKELMPKALELYNKRYKKFLKDREQFLKDYPKLKADWQKKDPVLYDETLYPNEDSLKAKFYVTLSQFRIAMPTENSGLYTAKEYAVQKKQLQEQMSEFLNETLSTIATNLYKIIKELGEKAGAGNGLNAKRLSTIKEFFETFDAMNITGNKELTMLKNKLESLVGTSEKEDWKDPDFAAKVVSETKKLAAVIEKDATLKRAIDY